MQKLHQHYSTKKTPQRYPVGEDQVKMRSGGYGWEVDDWDRLDRFLVLGLSSLMPGTLLLYSSVYGLSKQICERVQASLERRGQRADVAPLGGHTVDPRSYDAIVIGASIKHGKHHPSVLEFIRAHRALLESRPSGLFSVNPVARKPAKNTPQPNPYLKRLVAQSPWKPKLQAVFAGELDYSRYGPVDKYMIRLVMWINKGPTDFSTKVQFTDWDEVDRFADQVARLTAGAGVPVQPADALAA